MSGYLFDNPFEIQELIKLFSREGLDQFNESDIGVHRKNLSLRYVEVSNSLGDLKGNRWDPNKMHYRDNMSLAELRRLDKEFDQRVENLYTKLQKISSKIELIDKKLEFDKIFATKVLNFSLTKLQIGESTGEFLLVPASSAQRYYCSIQMLSTETLAGKTALFKEVGFQGNYLGPTGREIALKVISTQACTLEILSSFRLNPAYTDPTSAVLPRGNGGETRKQQLRPN